MAFKGLEGSICENTSLLNKFAAIKGIPGPRPTNHNPELKVSRKTGDLLEMKIDPRSAALVKNAMTAYGKRLKDVRFHLHGILLVDMWATFEAYIQSSLLAFYKKKPEVLRCNDHITVSEAISNREDILAYLVNRQIESIGHMSFDKICDYLNKRLNFAFTSNLQDSLTTYYALRNIFAHAGGSIVSTSAVQHIPIDQIDAKEKLVKIKRNYLETARKNILRSIRALDKELIKKLG
jgi:hypothetical protein